MVRDLGSTNGITHQWGQACKSDGYGWATSCRLLHFRYRRREEATDWRRPLPRRVRLDSGRFESRHRSATAPLPGACASTICFPHTVDSSGSAETDGVRSVVSASSFRRLNSRAARRWCDGQGRHLDAQPGVADDRLDQARRSLKSPE